MSLLLSIFLCKLVIATAFLAYASWCDVKTRRVSNRVWMGFAPLAILLTCMETCIVGVSWQLFASIGFTALYALGLFYAKAIGGADSKALICVGLMFPFWPFTQIGGFSIMVFVVAAGYLMPIVICSLVQRLRKCEYVKNVPMMPFMLAGFITLILVSVYLFGLG